MMWNIFYKKKNEIYRSFMALVIYGTVICLGYTFLGIEKITPLLAVTVALIFIYVVCVFEMGFIGKAILCSVPVSFGAVKLFVIEKESIVQLIRGFASWIYNPEIETTHSGLYLGVFILGVAVICYIAGYLCQKNKIIKCCLFSIGVFVSIYLMIRQQEVPKSGIAFLFSFIFIVIVEWIEHRWQKDSDSNERVLYMVCLWPVWIVFIIAMCFVPVSDKPYDWKYVKVINKNVGDMADSIAVFLGVGGGDDFSASMSGFSENTRIGGDIEDGNEILLQVDAPSKMMTNVYLTGIVSDTFDGREWHSKYDKEREDRNFDTLETLYAVWKYDGDGKDCYIEKANLKIEYKELSSYHYFIPNKCKSIMVNDYNIYSSYGEKNNAWKKRKRSGDIYIADYYQLNLDHDIFYEMVEASDYDDEEVWGRLCMNNLHERIDFAKFKEYQNRQKEWYKGDILLSDKMQQWVDDVTGDCQSDLERLRAIEKAIGEFTYTKHPGKIPARVNTPSEFLDYFILEKQEGYCTYFATAFTLLARAEGLPARYVQGFSVPLKEHRSVSVTGDMAHAWPEIYFEGVGWIPFEPTPGYSSVRYTPWKVKGEGGTINAASIRNAALQSEKASLDKHLEEEIVEEETGHSVDTDVFVWGIITALLLLVLILSVDIVICRLLYKKMTLRGRYRWEVERCISILERLGIRKRDEETLSDLQRIMEERYMSWEEAVPCFIDEYENVLYGTREVTEDMIQRVMTQRRDMKKKLRMRIRLVEEYRDCRKE